MKKILAMLLALCMVFALAACGGDPVETDTNTDPGTVETPDGTGSETPENEHKGTILWLAHISSGPQYDHDFNYLTACCEALGYDFSVVYGDMNNDAAGNLLNIQNAMTDDVVGLITSQDGGLKDIMEAYPDLYVAGFSTDLRSVYEEGGLNADCLANDHFLGTIADGYGNGVKTGENFAQAVIDKGYKKVALVNFPVFAYPSLTEAVAGFAATIEEYNKTASEPVEIVGEVTTLMFAPLEDSWFLEEGHSDLDAIVGFCAGVTFVYPTMVSAMSNGTCSPDTKLLTAGLEYGEALWSDIGENGVISYLLNTPAENCAYALIMLDNAISGNVAAGSTNACIDGAPYVIDSAEDLTNITTKGMYGTADPALAHLSVEEIVALCGRNNPDLTWEELVAVFQSISVDDLK